jgi:hypothetical protein
MACPFVIVDGMTFGAPELPQSEAPCYGCRRGLRRAAVFYPDGMTFDHVHELRPGVTIECSGTGWRMDQLFRDDLEVGA